VNEKVDIWMLGCVIFTLCFFIHPFAESQKLAIVNAAYIIPKNHNVNSKSNNNLKYSSKMTDFIRLLLTPNPKFRPSIFDVEKILMNWDRMQSIPLNVWKF
jgi:AP2-associated kinase